MDKLVDLEASDNPYPAVANGLDLVVMVEAPWKRLLLEMDSEVDSKVDS